MARITLNTTTPLTSTALSLPDNARVIIIDADTETETADLTINGAESIIVTDDTVQITTVPNAVSDAASNAVSEIVSETNDDAFANNVIAEMLSMLDLEPNGNDDADAEQDDVDETENTEDAEADSAAVSDDAEEDNAKNIEDTDEASHTTPTAVYKAGSIRPKYVITIEYDRANCIYTDQATGAEITEKSLIDVINCAYETSAEVDMTFNIPGHGITTFAGKFIDGYRDHAGLVLVSPAGGAYVLNTEQELTDDMSVLTKACFTFIGDADVLFEELDVTVVGGDSNSDSDDDDDKDDKDDKDDSSNTEDDDAHSQSTPAFNANAIPIFDADDKLYTRISSREHRLESTAIRRIVHYAATHDLSARLIIEGQPDPYVGRLQVLDNADITQYVFIDKKLGTVEIDLDEFGSDAGFSQLEIYSDTDMRRRGFAGTNHTEYDEISIAKMFRHIVTTLAK